MINISFGIFSGVDNHSKLVDDVRFDNPYFSMSNLTKSKELISVLDFSPIIENFYFRSSLKK